MDFARKQLEKYGWSHGKGLGKNENGISEALKPKLKRSVTGIGHDPASEFNEHWWTVLYDKAAKNVEVEDKNGKTKKIKTNSNDLVISSSTWKINKKQKSADESEYSEYFVRTAVLTNDKGGRKTENVRSDSESDEEEKKDVFKMTDEELFAACEGRTAHKGARHGLRATGKLARIAEQEQMLLTQAKYEGYSHAKKLKEKLGVTSDESVTKKKKRNKHLFGSEEEFDVLPDESQNCIASDNKNKREVCQSSSEVEPQEPLESVDSIPERKQKKKKRKDKISANEVYEVIEKKSKNNHVEEPSQTEVTEIKVSKSKKKKKEKDIYLTNKCT